MRESVTEKAGRLLLDGSVRLIHVDPDGAEAVVAGDTGTRHVTFDGHRWSCDCPSYQPCSHAIATARVVHRGTRFFPGRDPRHAIAPRREITLIEGSPEVARNGPSCADCGRKLQDFEADYPYYFHGLCEGCRTNYASCIRCGEIRPLKDMRQSYCVECRRAYDRDRWARQRAARGVR